MDVKDLAGAGLYVPFQQLQPSTVREVKFRLLDSILSLIGGALCVQKEEVESLARLLDTPFQIRPIFPLGFKTNLEMAGFLNAYFMRYADWGDTYRRQRGGVGGHPSDQIAAILALSDTPGLAGTRIIELIHLSYQLWAVLQEQMLFLRPDIDYTTTLSLTIPVVAATCFNEPPQVVQNALNLSASGGILLEQIRRDVTNLKSAASAYAIARGFYCYRFSKVIQAPESIFSGEYGWYKVIAPLEGELVSLGAEATYTPIQIKPFPCCNAAQSTVECALRLHPQLVGRLEQIKQIIIHLSPVETQIVNKPHQALYPQTQADADHHIRYCAATALQFGALTPLHYKAEYLKDKLTQHLIDLIDVQVLTSQEAAALGHQEGACILEVLLKDGSTLSERLAKASGILSGLDPLEREERFRKVLKKKSQMIEKVSGLHLSHLQDIVLELEEYQGKELIDKIQECLEGGG
ncbi:MAG: MmgE/PrpD family protein [Candidatus Caldatribacteriota bacterium]